MPAPVLQIKRGAAANIGIASLKAGEPGFTIDKYDFYIGLNGTSAGHKFFGSHRYWERENGNTSLKLKLVDRDGVNYVSIKTPNALAGIVTYTLPGVQGGTNTILVNDGSGNLSWNNGVENPVFTGIATFSDITDNILGNPNTGAVQIDGGLGVNKNVTIGAGLSVSDNSYFVSDLTVGKNLYVNGTTTQVNTTTLNVKDNLVDLGLIDNGDGTLVPPTSDLGKDIGLLLNYYTDSAKKAAMFWDDSAGRIVFADEVTESLGVLTVASNAYASIEIEGLWVNDCAGQSQVISCSGSQRNLENIVVDAGVY